MEKVITIVDVNVTNFLLIFCKVNFGVLGAYDTFLPQLLNYKAYPVSV